MLRVNFLVLDRLLETQTADKLQSSNLTAEFRIGSLGERREHEEMYLRNPLAV